MNFAEALTGAEKQRGGRGKRYCMISELPQSMPSDDFVAFEVALEDPSISTRQITRALNTIGLQTSVNTVLKHRNMKCACFT